MSVICPTITAKTEADYRTQLKHVSFAKRLHIDISDGVFAPTKLIALRAADVLHGKVVDLHFMCLEPLRYMEKAINFQPNLVIVHAEAKGGFIELAKELKNNGIKVGVALLPETEVKIIMPALKFIDHVLVFGGKLGYQGGEADLSLLRKAKDVRAFNPSIEIGWDGGVNYKNANQICQAGIDVLNVGGFIQKSQNPEDAYRTLENIV